MQQQSSSSSSNRFIEHDFCWKTKNSVVECKASENVCENLLDVLGESETYFLPSGWKLENHQLKFSSRLPLRNIYHILMYQFGDRAQLGIDTICFFFQHIMLFIMLLFCSNYAKKYAFCPTLCQIILNFA